MRIHGVNGYIDVEVTPDGKIQVSASEYDTARDRYGEMAVIRLTDTGAAALSSLLDTGGLELVAREEAKKASGPKEGAS